MKKILIFLGAIFVGNAYSENVDKIQKILPQLETYIQKAQSQWQAPSIAIVIVNKEKILYMKAFGEHFFNSKTKVNEKTVYQIASLSKNFLAILFAKLVAEKKLNWDDLVIKYLPDVFIGNEEITKKVTLRDLLSHRSGLPPFAGDSLWYVGFSQNELIKGLSKISLKSNFREDYAYQNHLFGIASLIAEKVTGKTIQELYQETFFTPLKMTLASVGLDGICPKKSFLKNLFQRETSQNIAWPHIIKENKPYQLTFDESMYLFEGSTGINLSIEDLGKWMQFHLGKGMPLIEQQPYLETLKPSITCNMREDDPQFPVKRFSQIQYGMGWFLWKYGSGDKKASMKGHMGGFRGVRSLFTIDDDTGIAIAIISNLGAMRVSFLPEAIRNKFFDLYYDLPLEDWSEIFFNNMKNIQVKNKQYKNSERLQSPKPALDLQMYEGVYTSEIYGDLTIQKKEKGLILSYRGKQITLSHFNGNEFSFDGTLLSDAYCEVDTGYIEFGTSKGKRVDVCAISLLYEGKEKSFFHKK